MDDPSDTTTDPITPRNPTPLPAKKRNPTDDLETFYTPIYAITGFFAAVFIIVPFLIRKGPDRWTYRACVMLTSFCMWILWVTIYIAQMNPIIGPRVTNETLAWIAYKWGDPMK